MTHKWVVPLLTLAVGVFPTPLRAQPQRSPFNVVDHRALVNPVEKDRTAEILRQQQQLRVAQLQLLLQQRAALAQFARTAFVVAQQDLDRLQAAPQQFPQVYRAYSVLLQTQLGKAFVGLTDEGYAAVFASLVAYQMKPYRDEGDPSPPPVNRTLAGLLGAQKLVCDEYCDLASQLFLTIPSSQRPHATFNKVGLDKGTVSNHAQLFIAGVGLPLMLDPTTGVVARADFASAFVGRAVPQSWIWRSPYQHAYSPEAAQEMSDFTQKVVATLTNGSYPRSVVLYIQPTVLPGQ